MREMRLFAVLAGLALAGCNLAPDYLRPAAPVPAQWPETAPAAGTRGAAALAWQEFFPDPRLRALIAAALDNNRDLRIAAARVLEAQALYGVARADRFPGLSLGADRQAARTPGDLNLTGHAVVTQRYDVDLAVPSFELDFWGRVKNLSDAALANYLATEEARRALRLTLVSDVADSYLGLRELEERSRLARETLKTRQESRDLIALRREVGIAGELDLLQAEGALQAARVELANLERQQSAAENALRFLVGGLPAQLPSGLSLKDQGIVPDLAAGLPSEVLLRRPDVLAAEQQLIAANANIGAARAAFFPRILLTGMFGTASAALSGLFKAGQGAWSFQPTLTLPLFDGFRNAANADLAEARKIIAVAQYEKTVQQAFRDIADLLAAREKLRQQLDASEAAERVQAERLRLTDARYRAGVANHLDLLDAERDAFATQQAAVQVRRQLLSAAARLYAALGGGMEAAATAAQ